MCNAMLNRSSESSASMCEKRTSSAVDEVCAKLSSNSWRSDVPLYVDGDMARDDDSLRRILEALSQNNTVRTLVLKHLQLESTDILENTFKNKETSSPQLHRIVIENVRVKGRKSLVLPSSIFMTVAEELSISRCRIDIMDDDTTTNAATATSSRRCLRSLEFDNVVFRGNSTSNLAAFLQRNCCSSNFLERLILANVRWCRLDLFLVLSSITSLKNLRYLKLDNLNIGKTEAAILATILQSNNHQLKTLLLPSNNLGGSTVLQTIFQNVPSSLRAVSLAYNPVGNDGARALVDTLLGGGNKDDRRKRSSSLLQELDLEHAEIWQEGCLSLIDGAASSGIETLGLEGNDIENCGNALVQAAMNTSTSLSQISGLHQLASQETRFKMEAFLRLNRGNRREVLAAPESLHLMPFLLEGPRRRSGGLVAAADVDFTYQLLQSYVVPNMQ